MGEVCCAKFNVNVKIRTRGFHICVHTHWYEAANAYLKQHTYAHAHTHTLWWAHTHTHTGDLCKYKRHPVEDYTMCACMRVCVRACGRVCGRTACVCVCPVTDSTMATRRVSRTHTPLPLPHKGIAKLLLAAVCDFNHSAPGNAGFFPKLGFFVVVLKSRLKAHAFSICLMLCSAYVCRYAVCMYVALQCVRM